MKEFEQLGMELVGPPIKLTEERKAILDAMSEVELFFILQEIFRLSGMKGCTELYDYIKLLLSKFDVVDSAEHYNKKFDKWLRFWRSWQSKLSIVDLKFIIDCIELKQSYDSVLPHLRWNQNKPSFKNRGFQA